MAEGMGFVWVNDTSKYHDLPTPIIWPEKTVFTTSVTHQLHCLVGSPAQQNSIAASTNSYQVHYRSDLLRNEGEPYYTGGPPLAHDALLRLHAPGHHVLR